MVAEAPAHGFGGPRSSLGPDPPRPGVPPRPRPSAGPPGPPADPPAPRSRAPARRTRCSRAAASSAAGSRPTGKGLSRTGRPRSRSGSISSRLPVRNTNGMPRPARHPRPRPPSRRAAPGRARPRRAAPRARGVRPPRRSRRGRPPRTRPAAARPRPPARSRTRPRPRARAGRRPLPFTRPRPTAGGRLAPPAGRPAFGAASVTPPTDLPGAVRASSGRHGSAPRRPVAVSRPGAPGPSAGRTLAPRSAPQHQERQGDDARGQDDEGPGREPLPEDTRPAYAGVPCRPPSPVRPRRRPGRGPRAAPGEPHAACLAQLAQQRLEAARRERRGQVLLGAEPPQVPVEADEGREVVRVAGLVTPRKKPCRRARPSSARHAPIGVTPAPSVPCENSISPTSPNGGRAPSRKRRRVPAEGSVLNTSHNGTSRRRRAASGAVSTKLSTSSRDGSAPRSRHHARYRSAASRPASSGSANRSRTSRQPRSAASASSSAESAGSKPHSASGASRPGRAGPSARAARRSAPGRRARAGRRGNTRPPSRRRPRRTGRRSARRAASPATPCRTRPCRGWRPAPAPAAGGRGRRPAGGGT